MLFCRASIKYFSDSVVTANPAQQMATYEQIKLIKQEVRKKKTKQAVEIFKNVVNFIVDDPCETELEDLIAKAKANQQGSTSLK